MEDIYLDKPLKTAEIRLELKRIFNGLTFFYYDFQSEAPPEIDFENPEHAIFNADLDEEKLEFGYCISIYRTPQIDSEERQLYIGKHFSETFGVRVIVPFSHPDHPGYPYYDVIFENGKTYLAEDHDTSFADGTEGLVKILEEYELPVYQFDAKGNLTGMRTRRAGS